MRTTVTFDPDVMAAIEQLKDDLQIGLSEAVNRLVRSGANSGTVECRQFRQRTTEMGAPRVDLSNNAEVLDFLDDRDHR